MADSYLPPLQKPILEPTQQRRTSSFRKRLRRTTSEKPEVAMHVLLPKIFGGEIAAYESDSEKSAESDVESDVESVPSPDSAVEVVTPPEGRQDIPPIRVISSEEIPEQSIKSSKDFLLPLRQNGKRRRALERDCKAKAVPKPRQHYQPTSSSRPRLEYRGPYTHGSSSTSSSTASTPRFRSSEHLPPPIDPLAVNQLSCALDQLCNLTVVDDANTSRGDRNGSLSGSLGDLLVNGSQGSGRKDSKAEGKRHEERDRELVLDGKERGRRLRSAASW